MFLFVCLFYFSDPTSAPAREGLDKDVGVTLLKDVFLLTSVGILYLGALNKECIG